MGTYSSVIDAKQKSSKSLGTPQNKRISATQIRNAAGGYVYSTEDWIRLERFLILGTEEGTYYENNKTITAGNAKHCVELLRHDGPRFVATVVEVSESGRAIKNSPAIFLLAMAAGWGNDETQNLCLKYFNKVCRTGSHVLEFVSYIQQFRGWGPRLRKIISSWYSTKDPKELLFQTTKYFNRNDWTQVDVIKKSHPKVQGNLSLVLRYLLKKEMSEEEKQEFLNISPLAKDLDCVPHLNPLAHEKACNMVVSLVSGGNLQREHLPTEWLQNDKVYEALAKNMPLTALIRNLVALSMRGFLTETSHLTQVICEKLRNQEALQAARIHPIQILLAMKHYETGISYKGVGSNARANKWIPSHNILLALNDAFNKSFGFISPTDKNIVVAIDFSGSMAGKLVSGLNNLSARTASLAMAMSHVNSEPNLTLLAFSSEGHGPTKKGYWPLEIKKGMSLDQICKYADTQDTGATDGSLPMMWALNHKVKDIDAFVLYTDNETWCGQQHVVEAIKSYRYYYNRFCKLIIAATTATSSSLVESKDVLSLDCAGFDANVPQVINSFILI